VNRTSSVTADVAIVGGGPAGSVLAALLARRGRRVIVLERAPAYRWRACGVFTSPAAVAELRRAGVAATELGRVARPIPAMRVEAPGAPAFRLTYGDDGSLNAPAVGFDRRALDPLLLALARDAGADVRVGAMVTAVARGSVVTSDGLGVTARVVAGADGLRSVVARSFRVNRPARIGSRVGMTFHVADPSGSTPRDARMIVFDEGYVGLAPVPGDRVNVGIVLGRSWAARLRADGATATARNVLARVPAASDDPVDWSRPEICDDVAGVAPLGHAVSARSGPGWLVVGDAAGFLDPFTGEGIHRSLVSARLAAEAIDADLDGDPAALARYGSQLTARFRAKDVVSLVVQGFLARPTAFGYAARRLAARSSVRETMGLVMGDLVPASLALDPRVLASLLRP
jgi:flavin-dependent dehydrogenase